MASVVVTGFLGAGKSTLAAQLRQTLGDTVVEHDALSVPPSGPPIITVADAVNLVSCLDQPPPVGPLVAAQLAAAGLVVVSRGDVVSPAPAIAAAQAVTSAPVMEAAMGHLDPALVRDLPPPPSQEPVDVSDEFTEWRYGGPARMRPAAVEALIVNRPKGVYRLQGVVRTEDGGLEVEVMGRLRQTRPVEAPDRTTLRAVGLRGAFRTVDLNQMLAEAAAYSVFQAGLFGHR